MNILQEVIAMYLTGYIKFDDELYYVVWNDIKSAETFWIFNPYHKDDIVNHAMGLDVVNPVISSAWAVKSFYNENYVEEILKRKKVSGEVEVYGKPHVVDIVLEALSFARNYRFAEKDIIKNTVTTMFQDKLYEFEAFDSNMHYSYMKDDFYFKKIKIINSNVELQLESAGFSLQLKGFELIEASNIYKKNVLNKTIKVIDYNALCEVLDMTWYKDGDVFKKDYKSIDNIRDFELQIMTPLIKAIVNAGQNGTVKDVAVDTETTGLNIYDLKPDNPDKDHCVAIPISWIPNTGYVVFTDMEHFNNVDNDYAVHRLCELFEMFKGERIVNYWEEDGNTNSFNKMNFFSEDVNKPEKQLANCKKLSATIQRDWINLIGHNVSFDKRVFIDSNCYFWFNNDTMQMAFNIHSKTIKGSNKLKTLTRKLFGHETPELTDILGKNNEDKYRFLVDREVAEIYGCADGDYTLQLYPVLRSLMSDQMYNNYQALDIPMLNILPRSEYYGLRIKEDEAIKLGETVYNNIQALKEFTYQYVGAYVDVYMQREKLKAKKAAGYFETEDDYQKAIQDIKIGEDVRFEFEFKPNELRRVLFDILKYPIKAYTEGAVRQPKLDKYAMKKLIADKRSETDTGFSKMEHDLLSTNADPAEYKRLRDLNTDSSNKKADKMVLVSAKDFNKCKYPIALILQKYAELNKEYTAYYKPMKETNMESRIFKGYSLARIETRRIQNAAQTMKGDLKALVIPYSDDYYMLDFDMSQVEYRIMLSLANHMLLIDKMSDPENDYHTETASLINNIPAHRVDKKTRKKAKSVSFGVPYGLGIYTLCESLFGTVNEENLVATRLLLAKWEKANKPIMDFLNKERDNALVARNMENELRDFMDAWEKDASGEYLRDMLGNKIPKPIGFIYDKYGFYRTFDLSNVEQGASAQARRANGVYNSEEGKIRRPAGNFPIQCFAAELFRIILIRFYMRCEEEGINDKLIWHMLIHDELLCSVHKSIHPFYIYKLVKESCMVTMKGHTKYFVGINIGNSWAETKDDAREAPVYFVNRIIKRWDSGEFGDGPFWFDDPWEELIKEERAKYVDTRINEVIHQVQPNIDNEPINIPWILDNFTNYTVRAYVNDYSSNRDLTSDAGNKSAETLADLKWVSRFETWALGSFPEGKPMIDYNGKLTVLRKHVEELEEPDFIIQDDLSFLFDEDDFADTGSTDGGYWSFDTTEVNDTYDYVDFDDGEDDTFSYEIDSTRTDAHNIAEMLKVKTKYKNISVMLEQAVLKINSEHARKVMQYLEPFVAKTGKSIVFSYNKIGKNERWLKVNELVNWEELDAYITNLQDFSNCVKTNASYLPKHFISKGDNIIITFKDKFKFTNCYKWLENFESSAGYTVVLRTEENQVVKIPFKIILPFQKLDKYISEVN